MPLELLTKILGCNTTTILLASVLCHFLCAYQQLHTVEISASCHIDWDLWSLFHFVAVYNACSSARKLVLEGPALLYGLKEKHLQKRLPLVARALPKLESIICIDTSKSLDASVKDQAALMPSVSMTIHAVPNTMNLKSIELLSSALTWLELAWSSQGTATEKDGMPYLHMASLSTLLNSIFNTSAPPSSPDAHYPKAIPGS
jgi:hypothetical protein